MQIGMRDEFGFTVNFLCHTDGSGLWSTAKEEVHITSVILIVYEEHGELRAYFDPLKWDYNKLGLIYTDNLWMDEFRACMKDRFKIEDPEDISYSEQGMQGDEYVSMDIGGDSIPCLVDFWKCTKEKERENV